MAVGPFVITGGVDDRVVEARVRSAVYRCAVELGLGGVERREAALGASTLRITVVDGEGHTGGIDRLDHEVRLLTTRNLDTGRSRQIVG